MALESGAPVVPVAVSGSEHARRGWRIRPVKVHLRFGAPLTFPRVDRPSPFLAGEVTERIWPCVALQWEWLGGLPPLRTAVVVGAGPMGTAAATVLARAGLEVHLTCRTREQAERIAAGGGDSGPLPGVELDRRIEVSALRDVELAGVDLVVLAVPCSALPAAVGEIGAHMGERSAVLVASKGLVPPLGTTPSAFVAERVRARAVASLAGPADPREAIEAGASVVLATGDAELRRQLGEVLQAGGLTVQTTDDVTGTELAACARNAAALASAAAAAARIRTWRVPPRDGSSPRCTPWPWPAAAGARPLPGSPGGDLVAGAVVPEGSGAGEVGERRERVCLTRAASRCWSARTSRWPRCRSWVSRSSVRGSRRR